MGKSLGLEGSSQSWSVFSHDLLLKSLDSFSREMWPEADRSSHLIRSLEGRGLHEGGLHDLRDQVHHWEAPQAGLQEEIHSLRDSLPNLRGEEGERD